MIFVFDNCNEEDYKTISTHLFSKQIRLFFKDGSFKVGVDIDSTSNLTFLARVLDCDFLFRPFSYEHDGKWYNTLEIVRKNYEDKDSRDGVQSE